MELWPAALLVDYRQVPEQLELELLGSEHSVDCIRCLKRRNWEELLVVSLVRQQGRHPLRLLLPAAEVTGNTENETESERGWNVTGNVKENETVNGTESAKGIANETERSTG